jgi:hypothetical protein
MIPNGIAAKYFLLIRAEPDIKIAEIIVRISPPPRVKGDPVEAEPRPMTATRIPIATKIASSP